MTVRLGLSITTNEVRAILVTGISIAWRMSVPRAEDEEIADAVARVVGSAPPGRWRPSRVCVAVGLHRSQFKQLAGLPPSNDMRVLSQVLRENSSSFFLSPGGRLAVSNVAPQGDGSLWATAFDHVTVHAVALRLRDCGFQTVQFRPSTWCVASLVAPGTYDWCEDDLIAAITVQHGGKISDITVRHSATAAPERAEPIVHALGEGGWVDAAAYGAAMAQRHAQFAWHPEGDPGRVLRGNRLRTTVAAALFLLGCAAAVLAPGLRATVGIRRASAEAASVKASRREISHVQDELRRTAALLERLQRWDARRGEITLLLGALSAALPDSTALVNLRVDSLDGSLVGLTPRASNVLPPLVNVHGMSAPRIVGSVTREATGGVTLERATIRFRRAKVTR